LGSPYILMTQGAHQPAMKVLVAYASKYGATEGIAESLGTKLREMGLRADVAEVGEAKDVGSYDAYVVGSAVYMFHWMKEARRFVAKNKTVLAAHPLWLFSSGPVGTNRTDSKGRDVIASSEPKELGEYLALKPRDHKVFFGALDGSKLTGTTGFFYRMARRSESARKEMPEGDFRDWKEIEAWAGEIARALTA